MTPELLSRTWRWGLLALAVMTVLWLLAPVLAPFVVAAVLAYILHAPVLALRRRGLPRLLAVLLVEAVALLAVLGLLLLLVPVLLHELPLLREQVRRSWARGVNPRVFNPFLPHGYEEQEGIDYFGRDLRGALRGDA